MALRDVDFRRRTVTVRLKGARDEHRVPVTADWWPLLAKYLNDERLDAETPALWIGRRQGKNQPLRYPAFEASFRRTATRLGVKATAHMFRHTLAQQLVNTAGLKVAQEILGHRNVSTTADEYAYVDEPAMLAALTDLARRPAALTVASERPYAFPYDPWHYCRARRAHLKELVRGWTVDKHLAQHGGHARPALILRSCSLRWPTRCRAGVSVEPLAIWYRLRHNASCRIHQPNRKCPFNSGGSIPRALHHRWRRLAH